MLSQEQKSSIRVVPGGQLDRFFAGESITDIAKGLEVPEQEIQENFIRCIAYQAHTLNLLDIDAATIAAELELELDWVAKFWETDPALKAALAGNTEALEMLGREIEIISPSIEVEVGPRVKSLEQEPTDLTPEEEPEQQLPRPKRLFFLTQDELVKRPGEETTDDSEQPPSLLKLFEQGSSISAIAILLHMSINEVKANLAVCLFDKGQQDVMVLSQTLNLPHQEVRQILLESGRLREEVQPEPAINERPQASVNAALPVAENETTIPEVDIEARPDTVEAGNGRSRSWKKPALIILGLVILFLVSWWTISNIVSPDGVEKIQPGASVIQKPHGPVSLVTIKVVDLYSQKGIRGVRILNAEGETLLGKTRSSGLVDIAVYPAQELKIVHPDYVIWNDKLPADGLVVMERPKAKVYIKAPRIYVFEFYAYRYEQTVTAERNQADTKIEIPINEWVESLVRIGETGQYARTSIFLNSPDDIVYINVTDEQNGPVVTWEVNSAGGENLTLKNPRVSIKIEGN